MPGALPPGGRIGIDPDPERVRIAELALGNRGTVVRGLAPDLPPLPAARADVVLLLDMLHYLDDETVAALFLKAFASLTGGGILAARCTILSGNRPTLLWRFENARIRWSGNRAWYRTPGQIAEFLYRAGFTVVINEISSNPELAWLVGRADKKSGGR